MKKYWHYAPLLVLVFLADQLFKNWAYHSLRGKANFLILGRFFSLEFYQNRGIAFGIPLPTWFFFISFGVIMLILVYFFYQYFQKKLAVPLLALSAILLGAISNAIDRLRFGYVIDYLNLNFWPVFNLADILVVGGVIVLFCTLTREKQDQKSKIKSF